MNANTKWKVCVRCFTYNQAAYITDALDGFAMQQTDFPYVCTIVDDASTDGEPDVIRQYLADHFDVASTPEPDGNGAYTREMEYGTLIFAPHRTNRNCSFAVLLLKENHYSIRKPKLPYLAEWTDGVPYIALCEGDDYWTAPHKLQTQVAFLDSHPDYGMSYTRARMYIQDKQEYGNDWGGDKTTFGELLIGNVIPTLTVVVRRCLMDGYRKEIQPETKGWLMGDFPLWLYCSANSKVQFIPEATGIYRKLLESASHSTDVERYCQFAKNYLDIKLFFLEKYKGKTNVTAADLERTHFRILLRIRHTRKAPQLIPECKKHLYLSEYNSTQTTIYEHFIDKDWGGYYTAYTTY